MDITPPWSSEDTDILRTFLNTQTGSRLIPKLGESAPLLLERGDANAILIRNGKLLGFQAALREIFNLAYPPPPAQVDAPSTYPPLTADDQWNDGQKIETPEP